MKFTHLNARGLSHVFLPLLVVVGVAVVGAYTLVASHADTNSPVITAATANAQDVLSYPQSACPPADPKRTARSSDNFDIPDTSPRAYVDAGGRVQLMAGHDSTYLTQANAVIWDPVKGFTFTHNCAERSYTSQVSSNYDQYRSFEWLESFSTKEGQNILGIISNDWNGHDWPQYPQCQTTTYKCWWGTLTMVQSLDQGHSFIMAPGPRPSVAPPGPRTLRPDLYHDPAGQLLAAPPEGSVRPTVDPLRDNRTGYFGITNIMKNPLNGNYYLLANTTNVESGKSGVCIMRADKDSDLQQFGSWRGFSGFSAINGQAQFTANIRNKEICKLSPSPIYNIRSITYSTALDKFVSVIMKEDGVYIATTSDPDLVKWDDVPTKPAYPALAEFSRDKADVRAQVQALGGDPNTGYYYPSLIDHSYLNIVRGPAFANNPQKYPYAAVSERRNFDIIGNHPYLYIVRWDSRWPNSVHQEQRTVVRIPLTIDKASAAQ